MVCLWDYNQTRCGCALTMHKSLLQEGNDSFIMNQNAPGVCFTIAVVSYTVVNIDMTVQ